MYVIVKHTGFHNVNKPGIKRSKKPTVRRNINWSIVLAPVRYSTPSVEYSETRSIRSNNKTPSNILIETSDLDPSDLNRSTSRWTIF